MSNSIPHEVVGLAVLLTIFTCLSLACGVLLLYMQICHGERYNHIFFIAVFACFSTAAAIAQQINYDVNWRQKKIAIYERAVQAVQNHLIIAGRSTPGLDAGLFWIQFYCYNVISLLAMFWSIALFRGTWNLQLPRSLRGSEGLIDVGSKSFAVLFPILVIGISQAPAVKANQIAYLTLLNLILLLCLASGSIFILLTLIKFLQSRRKLKSVRASPANVSISALGTSAGATGIATLRRNINDRWLIMRFSIAFALLSIFEVVILVSEFTAMQDTKEEATKPGPDFSVHETKTDLARFLPATTIPLFIFLLFGTTSHFRHVYTNRLNLLFRRKRRIVSMQNGQKERALFSPMDPSSEQRTPTIASKEGKGIAVTTDVELTACTISEAGIVPSDIQQQKHIGGLAV